MVLRLKLRMQTSGNRMALGILDACVRGAGVSGGGLSIPSAGGATAFVFGDSRSFTSVLNWSSGLMARNGTCDDMEADLS